MVVTTGIHAFYKQTGGVWILGLVGKMPRPNIK